MRRQFRSTRSVLVLCLFLAAAACSRVAKLEPLVPEKKLYSIGGTATVPVNAVDKKGKAVASPKLKWSTSDEKIVRVSETGELTSAAAGQATVTARAGKASADIRVKVIPIAAIRLAPEDVNLIGPVGSTVPVIATILDDKLIPVDEKVRWSSTSESVATVSPEGIVTSKGNGRAKIVASLEGTKGEANVLVDIRNIMKIVIHPETTIMRIGDSEPFNATVFDENSTAIPNAAVTWKSTDPSVATVDPNGLVRTLAQGACSIEATFVGKVASSSVIVN